jgi:broad specificity phosphatase PhoE
LTETLHPEEIITSFLLIRHGATKPTEEGRIYHDPQVPLTDKGLDQARALATWLEAQKPDVLLSSPAYRVRTTAAIVGTGLRLSPTILEDLDEWRIGAWEGRTYLEIKKAEPDLYHKWSSDPIHSAPPDGESVSDLCRRVDSILPGVISQFEGRRLALVTHAGIIRAILIQALGMPVENFWRLVIPTGSVSRVDYSANFATVHFLAHRPQM